MSLSALKCSACSAVVAEKVYLDLSFVGSNARVLDTVNRQISTTLNDSDFQIWTVSQHITFEISTRVHTSTSPRPFSKM